MIFLIENCMAPLIWILAPLIWILHQKNKSEVLTARSLTRVFVDGTFSVERPKVCIGNVTGGLKRGSNYHCSIEDWRHKEGWKKEHYPCAIKVHHALCTQLRTLIDRILRISSDIEAARPGCSAGMQALCLLQGSIGKAKLLLQNCSEPSWFYLAITSDGTVSRFEKIRKQLVQSLHELQSMVPMNLKLEISQIIDELRHAVFILESSEQEAGKAVRALLQKEDNNCMLLRKHTLWRGSCSLELSEINEITVTMDIRSLKTPFKTQDDKLEH